MYATTYLHTNYPFPRTKVIEAAIAILPVNMTVAYPNETNDAYASFYYSPHTPSTLHLI